MKPTEAFSCESNQICGVVDYVRNKIRFKNKEIFKVVIAY